MFSFKNLKLGTKMGIGFGALILIAGALGGFAVLQMNTVLGMSQRLADEYVNEVDAANKVERYSLLTMYNMRAYGLTGDVTYLTTGNGFIGQAKSAISEAQDLAKSYKDLLVLKENVDIAVQKTAQYEKLIGDTETANKGIDANRTQLETAAAEFLTACYAFLDSQETKLSDDIGKGAVALALNERYLKTKLVNEVVDLGNAVRIANFKAQALRDLSIIDAVMGNFNSMNTTLDKLEGITTQNDDLKQLNTVRDEARQYQTALNDLAVNWKALDELNVKRNVAAEEVLSAAQTTAARGFEQMSGVADGAVSALGTASNAMIIGLLIAALIGIILAVYLTTLITKPVRSGVQFAKRMSDGDFTQTLDVHQEDEIGDLAEALRVMVDRISGVVRDVQSAAVNVFFRKPGDEFFCAADVAGSDGAGRSGRGSFFIDGADEFEHPAERGQRAADRKNCAEIG